MLLLLLIAAAVLAIFLYKQLYTRRDGLPPGPLPLPLIGNLGGVLTDLNRLPDRINRWCRQYGGICTVWLPDPQVMISDYAMMKELFVTKGELVTGRPNNFLMDSIFFGNTGLVFSDGRLWRQQRRFALHVLRDFGFGRGIMEEKIAVDLDRLVEYLERQCGNDGATLDPSWALSVAIGSVIANLAFNYRYHFENDKSFERFAQLNKEFFEGMQSLNSMLVSNYPWLLHVPSVNRQWQKEMVDTETEWREFFQGMYDYCKQNLAESGATEATCYTEAFIMEMDRRKRAGEPEESFTELQLYVAVSDLWSAGMETTITTIRWGLLYMALWPDVQEKLAAEIVSTVGTRRVRMSDKARMPYTNATLTELQRYADIVPVNLPHRLLADVQCGGHLLRADTTVCAQISAVHKSEEHFDDPNEFRPERFLEPIDSGLNSPEKVMPFSLGKRACLGESLARMELFLIFTTLVQNFSFSIDRPMGDRERRRLLAGNWQITRVPDDYELTIKRRI